MSMPQPNELSDYEHPESSKRRAAEIYPEQSPISHHAFSQRASLSPQKVGSFYPICASVHGHAVVAVVIENEPRVATASDVRTVATVLAMKRDDLLESMIAACALVAQADGGVDVRERRRVEQIVRALSRFAEFSTEDVVEKFKHSEQAFERDPSGARNKVLEAVTAFRVDPESTRLLLCSCQSVLEADGIHHPAEYQALHELGRAFSAA